jgi:hypothetical protein
MHECDNDRSNRVAAPSTQARAPQKQRGSSVQRTRSKWALMVAAGLCLPASQLAAQAPAEPAPVAPAPPAPAPAVESTPVVSNPVGPEPEVHAATPALEPALAEPTPVEPVVEAPPAAPTLKIGMGVRTGLGLTVHNPADNVQLALNDGLFDSATVRPYLSSQLTKHIGVTANMDVETSGFNLLDAIVQIKFMDELQLWVGQHIPAQDRNNFCGPYFNNSWNFAVNVQAYPMDFAARDRGFTFWGLVAGGILKYHLSVVDLQAGREIGNARIGGRATLNLLDKENYYYSSGTYFGAQDTLALGVAFQYQNGVSASQGGVDKNMDGKVDNDFVGFSADLLFEKNLKAAGTITLEGGYWNFDGTGKEYGVNQGITVSSATSATQFSGPQPGQSVLAAVSWLTPTKIGIGYIQPNIRIQYANKDAGDVKVYDVGVASWMALTTAGTSTIATRTRRRERAPICCS